MRVLPVLACFVGLPLTIAAAHAQSADTLEGMRAYNRRDFEVALSLLTRAEQAGDPEAAVNLGYMYARGQEVSPDQQTALRLYRKAAEAGSGEGMNAIGFKYRYGTGVPIDYAAAAYWFCRAIERGNPRALNNLGLMLAEGAGLGRDIAEARSLWRQAAAARNPNAKANLGFSYLDPTAGAPDRRAALPWLVAAARDGQPKAQAWLRANGFSEAWPSPVDEGGLMLPEGNRPPGQSKVCDALTS